ncbi:hypothetical protein B0J11DRAFT_139 [Dendryphion nanum]|uniref:Uncharacterized protein n=1 Tax=Dendryphion nanum TaxID=256645 RepID=A0A9P9EIA3_9PLEO|nr:hypothetical protein B0J11DRAFT_139 [Dendryphion nanum]
MQAQHNQYGIMPLQQQNPAQYQGQIQTNPPPIQPQPTGPFSHIINIPVFQVYSLNEVHILYQRIQSNLALKQQRQDILDNMPPPPSTVDALSAKLFIEIISAMSDGGMTIIAKHTNIEKMMAGTLGVLDKMDQSSMKENTWCTYMRWASPKEMPGPLIILDVIAWYRNEARDKLSGVQVKTNTGFKIKLNKESFSIKEGKSFDKTWFRGRENTLAISVIIGDGTEVALGQVLAMERGLSSVVLSDFSNRWKEHVVPKV